MSRIRFDSVEKRYGDQVAVTGFDLEVAQGELVALLGPSGCGKTTSLRMVAGFVEATSGRIFFGERDVTDLPPYKRNTGMVFQSYALFPHLTVADNVAFGLERRRLPKADIVRRVREALARVRLEPLAERLPRQLSGGQQQRVALARALVIEPDVLLLDEPLSNLDAKLREEMRAEIRELQRGLGVTTIFVTHDQEEALAVANRLVVMNAGRIEQIGSPLDLYERPRTRFVAGFIGKSSLFEGAPEGPGRFRAKSGAVLAFPPDRAVEGATALAVRPERIALADEGGPAPAGGNALPGTIATVTFLGPTTEYVVRLDTGETVLVHAQNREASPLRAPGTRVAAGWPASASNPL